MDTVKNELVVADEINSILVFGRTANDNTAPMRTISGAATGLNFPEDVAVDTVNNELVVANASGNSVTVYSRTANGNVAPMRTIAGAATALNSPFFVAVTTGAPPAGAQLNSVAPCRLADTRDPVGPYGGPALAANADRTFVITTKCGIPVGARAVAFNFTVTQPTGPWDLRVFPGGVGLPLVSVINWRAGQTRANNAVVSLGPSGDIVAHVDQRPAPSTSSSTSTGISSRPRRNIDMIRPADIGSRTGSGARGTPGRAPSDAARGGRP